ncbi:hypothetical protein K3495_g1484 [Podosphaera aphanis]|nr:hypothetical protein K3495_g1484 [Podosphaera aphanis]
MNNSPAQYKSPSIACRNRQLTRDQRLQVLTLNTAGHTQQFIANHLNVTRRQVGYAIAHGCPTPKKSSGRRPRLSKEQIDELESFVRSSEDGKYMSYLQLANGPFGHWNVSESVIKRALKNRGCTRHKTIDRYPLPENKTIDVSLNLDSIAFPSFEYYLAEPLQLER